MTSDETTPRSDDWQVPEGSGSTPASPPVPPAAPRSGRSRRTLTAAGLVVAGVLLGVGGAVLAGSLSASGDTRGTDRFVPAAGAEGYGGVPGGAPGGVAGEQHLTGTLTQVGSSSITVRIGSRTSTYQVGSSTQIVRNGTPAKLSDLKAGDPVVVHLVPTSGGAKQVERIFAGTLPTGGPGGGDGGGFDGHDGGQH